MDGKHAPSYRDYVRLQHFDYDKVIIFLEMVLICSKYLDQFSYFVKYKFCKVSN